MCLFLVSSVIHYLDVSRRTCELEIVLDIVLEFREVPTVPLTHTHSKSVDVFVKLVQECNRLNDHVVSAARVELDLQNEENEQDN